MLQPFTNVMLQSSYRFLFCSNDIMMPVNNFKKEIVERKKRIDIHEDKAGRVS